MLFTNHVLTGALIGLKIQDPILIAPTAFASHLVLDSLPHTGLPDRFRPHGFDSGVGLWLAVVDVLVATAVYFALVMTFPDKWLVITLGALFAGLPDLVYIPQRFLGITIGKAFLKLHGVVQWGEFPGGIVIDAVWASFVGYLILQIPH